MPKKIDWDAIREDFLEDSGLTYERVATRHGVSRQSVEKRGADEGWQLLRQSLQRQESMVAEEAQQENEFNLDNVLKRAISLSFEQLQTAQPRSFEGVIESISKLSEIYLKVHPPRPPSVADWVDKAIAFDLDVAELMRRIKERAMEIG